MVLELELLLVVFWDEQVDNSELSEWYGDPGRVDDDWNDATDEADGEDS